MHKVASRLVARSKSVRKMRPLATMGDESPDPTAVFQRTFWLGPNSTGGLPSPIPEALGPLNCGQSAAPAVWHAKTTANDRKSCFTKLPFVTRPDIFDLATFDCILLRPAHAERHADA